MTTIASMIVKQYYEEQIRAEREKHMRGWLKPRIRRVAGTWICAGRGVTATGLTPLLAYSTWSLRRQVEMSYATYIGGAGK